MCMGFSSNKTLYHIILFILLFYGRLLCLLLHSLRGLHCCRSLGEEEAPTQLGITPHQHGTGWKCGLSQGLLSEASER